MAFTTTVREVIDNDKTGLLTKHFSWERVQLIEVATILNGAPFDSAMFSITEGHPLIRIRDVLTGTTSTYYRGTYDEAYVVRHGELVVGMDGDFNSAYWGAVPALLNQRVCKITPDESFYSRAFLGHLLPGYLAAINANTSAITVKHLSSKTIGEIELPLPPRNEQTRIVEKLEELLSDLDAGVAELKAAQKKLGQYRQSLLKAAVEGALTAGWRKQRQKIDVPSSPRRRGSSGEAGKKNLDSRLRGNDESETGAQLLQRILSERCARWEAKQLAKFASQGKAPPKDWQKKYPEPVQPDTSGLPELPQGWVWASVDQLSPDDLANGRSVPTGEVGAKVLRLTAVKNGQIDLDEYKHGDWSENDAKQFFVSEGDLLIVRGNGSLSLVGRAGLVGSVHQKVAYPDTMIRLRVVDTVVSTSWIAALWDSQLVRNHLERRARTSAGIYKISQPDIVSAPIPVPPLKEQEQLLTLLEQQQLEINGVAAELVSGLKQSAAQRKNILKAAFSGQLVPQDPNDEPASVLLQRIRAERAKREAVKKPRGRKTKEQA